MITASSSFYKENVDLNLNDLLGPSSQSAKALLKLLCLLLKCLRITEKNAPKFAHTSELVILFLYFMGFVLGCEKIAQ